RTTRGDPGPGPAAALAVHPGRARGALAHRLQRTPQGARPSRGAARDRARLRAPPGVPHRFVPPGRTQPERCPAPRAPGLCRLRRLPAAQPATAAAAPATRRVRGLCRAHDGHAHPVLTPSRPIPFRLAPETPVNARTKDLPATPPATTGEGSSLRALNDWVAEVARLTRPDAIHWCDGSDGENAKLVAAMEADGTLVRLNEKTHPQSWLHRSDPQDVARVEHLTLVCTPERDDAGPNNHWMAPEEAHAKIDALFDGCMQGRTMYVIPYCMGPIDSPLSRCGVEITDSPYVVANMRIMTRMGAPALRRIERE